MISVPKINSKKRGFNLIELTVVMAMTGIIFVSLSLIFQEVFLVLRRVRTQEIVSLQIDPLKTIFQKDVKASRFALYDSLNDAETNYNDKTKLIESADSTNNPNGFALRCTLRSGIGVFIIYWNPAPPNGGDAGVYLVAGQQPGSNPGNTFGPPIPITYALSYFGIDLSQGFVSVSTRILSPLVNASGANAIYQRSTATGANAYEIPYNFIVESSL